MERVSANRWTLTWSLYVDINILVKQINGRRRNGSGLWIIGERRADTNSQVNATPGRARPGKA
jgi:hypothetical protein